MSVVEFSTFAGRRFLHGLSIRVFHTAANEYIQTERKSHNVRVVLRFFAAAVTMRRNVTIFTAVSGRHCSSNNFQSLLPVRVCAMQRNRLVAFSNYTADAFNKYNNLDCITAANPEYRPLAPPSVTQPFRLSNFILRIELFALNRTRFVRDLFNT